LLCISCNEAATKKTVTMLKYSVEDIPQSVLDFFSILSDDLIEVQEKNLLTLNAFTHYLGLLCYFPDEVLYYMDEETESILQDHSHVDVSDSGFSGRFYFLENVY